MRVSIPGAPLGILVKSSRPRCFCSAKVQGQWSVATVCSLPSARARQRCSQFRLSLRGGERTNLAPSKPGRS